MKATQINASLSHTNFNLNSSSCQLGRRASFRCRAISPLNPSNTTDLNGNKLHLSNLDKLLQTYKQPADQDYLQTQHKPMISTKKQTSSRTSFHRIMEAAGGGFNLDRIPFLPPSSNSFRVEDAAATGGPMSPGYLSRLHRLLSASSDHPSPRNHIANRWREFHGSNDWSGLLDPLDENLRREIVRYGEFVQAAYKHFDLEPAAGRVENETLPSPDKFYKVTKGLYATSSIGLPKWVDEMAPGWMTQRSSRIGYVAVCDDKREIQRMGRRDIVISLRGTLTCLEWAENVRAQLVPLKKEQQQTSQAAAQDSQAEVECGFLNLFTSPGVGSDSLANSIVDEIRRLTKLYEGEALSITIVGHSLGAALAVLAADHLANEVTEEGLPLPLPPVVVFSFGGPRVGNQAFVDRVESRENVKVLRVVNAQDVVTRVPGMMVSEEVERTLREKGGERLAGVLDRGYAHVGVELRLETKMSPYLRPDADMACCHDLEAYLHLVDGFMASNCPYRENAKRSLGRLLSEQGSNVKKLYTMSSSSSSSKVLESSSTMVDVPTAEGLSRSKSFQTV